LKATKNFTREKYSMTFDELWRMNLAEEKRRLDSTSGREQLGTQTIDEESRNELELTDEDRTFLLQVGIMP
jgi:hypothetical protein